jgi:branched-chain amino acid transport system permease protein
MDIAQWLNGLALGALLLALASGLALIYGLRGVMNFGHGALYMLGAYLSYEIAGRTTFWVALLLVPLLLAGVGAVLELLVFRPLQGRSPIEVALVTFGIALVLDHVIVLIWGKQTLSVPAPPILQGSVEMLGIRYPAYRLMLIAVALVTSAILIAVLRHSRTGLHVRASSHDRETTAIMGVNIDRVSLFVVSAGTALAGLAGVLAAPYLAVEPGMGTSILVSSLIVVVVGGLGSIEGAMGAAVSLGILQVLGTVWFPAVAVLVPYAALIAVLLWRPSGIAGKRVQ